MKGSGYANPARHPSTDVGELLRVVRVSRRRSLRYISLATKLPAARISEFERGLRIPTLEEARLLWKALSKGNGS